MKVCGYNKLVNFGLRDFRAEDFDSLWRIDQECFAPGIAYSRLELAAYIRLRGAFTLVAEALASEPEKECEQCGRGIDCREFWVSSLRRPRRRGVGHILTIDVPPAEPTVWDWFPIADHGGRSFACRRLPQRRTGNRCG